MDDRVSTASGGSFETTIAPWLAVRDAQDAVDFYAAAFGAIEEDRLDGDDGRVAVARLSVGGAPFWVQDDPDASPIAPGVGSSRAPPGPPGQSVKKRGRQRNESIEKSTGMTSSVPPMTSMSSSGSVTVAA